ncbi:hypothetical protein L3i20_v235650 [Paenibacillus sp. L3-i20]|nr:hypothetical protein L3i20_v235650 [Paenibacillus sp. L3-i20]
MVILILIVIIIGLSGIIGNQYSSLRRAEQMQRSLDDINQKLREISNNSKL